MDPIIEVEKLSYMRVMVIPIVIGALRTVPKSLEKGLNKLEISGRIEAVLTTCEIHLNTEMSPGDLVRLVVTQTSVKDHQLTLV